MRVVVKSTNLQGVPCGESHHWTKYPQSFIDETKQLAHAGMSIRAIAARLGVSHGTVWDWLSGRRRRPPVRVMARRIKEEKT